MEYLDALETQHEKWIANTTIPVLTLSTEVGVSVEENMEHIRSFVQQLKLR
jgi:hypothetical protein